MLKAIRKALLRKNPVSVQPPADFPIEPEEPFVAIGDVHGTATELMALLSKAEAIYPGQKVVCVGDYVDRGRDSASVLHELMHRSLMAPNKFICLAGNHEHMLLDFIDNPERAGRSWMKHGGLQTLESFGVLHAPSAEFADTRDALQDALGQDLILWLRGLPLFWQSGNIGVVHAAAAPELPLDAQAAKSLLWGHPDFGKTPRPDRSWIVHGHVIVADPIASNGCVAIDTGAYATGRLTAVHVSLSGFSFLSSR